MPGAGQLCPGSPGGAAPSAHPVPGSARLGQRWVPHGASGRQFLHHKEGAGNACKPKELVNSSRQLLVQEPRRRKVGNEHPAPREEALLA